MSRDCTFFAVAGDSGSGKDTLITGFSDAFNSIGVSHLSGDDFHLYDRKSPMWTLYTHLNPLANDLAHVTSLINSLEQGEPVSYQRYDHKFGIKMDVVSLVPNPLIIHSGLHALFVNPMVRKIARFLLLVDDEVRIWQKIRRDSTMRGYTPDQVRKKEMDRSKDRSRFTACPPYRADITFKRKYYGRHPDTSLRSRAQEVDISPHVNLEITLPYFYLVPGFFSRLIAISGLSISKNSQTSEQVTMSIEGEFTVEDFLMIRSYYFTDDEAKVGAVSSSWAGDNAIMLLQMLLVYRVINGIHYINS
jgi:uridine kinase